MFLVLVLFNFLKVAIGVVTMEIFTGKLVENGFSEIFGIFCVVVDRVFEIFRPVVWGEAEALVVGDDCAVEGLGLGWLGAFD
jgi:hypothetical protein